jgi:hypothetical protein
VTSQGELACIGAAAFTAGVKRRPGWQITLTPLGWFGSVSGIGTGTGFRVRVCGGGV